MSLTLLPYSTVSPPRNNKVPRFVQGKAADPIAPSQITFNLVLPVSYIHPSWVITLFPCLLEFTRNRTGLLSR